MHHSRTPPTFTPGSYEPTTFKRPRGGSISGRLRSASDLCDDGVISAQQKGLIKDLIITGDPELEAALEQYENGDPTRITALLDQGHLQKRRASIDMLGDDLDMGVLNVGSLGDGDNGPSADHSMFNMDDIPFSADLDGMAASTQLGGLGGVAGAGGPARQRTRTESFGLGGSLGFLGLGGSFGGGAGVSVSGGGAVPTSAGGPAAMYTAPGQARTSASTASGGTRTSGGAGAGAFGMSGFGSTAMYTPPGGSSGAGNSGGAAGGGAAAPGAGLPGLDSIGGISFASSSTKPATTAAAAAAHAAAGTRPRASLSFDLSLPDSLPAFADDMHVPSGSLGDLDNIPLVSVNEAGQVIAGSLGAIGGGLTEASTSMGLGADGFPSSGGVVVPSSGASALAGGLRGMAAAAGGDGFAGMGPPNSAQPPAPPQAGGRGRGRPPAGSNRSTSGGAAGRGTAKRAPGPLPPSRSVSAPIGIPGAAGRGRGQVAGKKYIGAYSPESRRKMLDRWKEKRKRRVWAKNVKYDVRKNFADSRLRVKGRFVKKEDEQLLRELIGMT